MHDLEQEIKIKNHMHKNVTFHILEEKESWKEGQGTGVGN